MNLVPVADKNTHTHTPFFFLSVACKYRSSYMRINPRTETFGIGSIDFCIDLHTSNTKSYCLFWLPNLSIKKKSPKRSLKKKKRQFYGKFALCRKSVRVGDTMTVTILSDQSVICSVSCHLLVPAQRFGTFTEYEPGAFTIWKTKKGEQNRAGAM